jgi:HEAT repeat protein
MVETKKNIPFQQVITLLQDANNPFPASLLYRFSDLSTVELDQIKEIWPKVDTSRRVHLLEDLEELALNNTLVLFDDLARFALDDKNPEVCTAAISLLWECEDPKLAPCLIKLTHEEHDPRVRVAAASALGMFVQLGELDKISPALKKRVEETLLDLVNSKEVSNLRRHALEALGYSGRKEVPPLIRAAYNHTDPLWVSSSLFAMGRSADEIWEKSILKMLDHPDLDVQVEAVRAAGALELRSSRKSIIDILKGYYDLDIELRRVCIWSLSQIGGRGISTILNTLLENCDDDEEAAFIEEAIENLSLNEEVGSFDIFDIDPSDEDQRIIIDPEGDEMVDDDDD